MAKNNIYNDITNLLNGDGELDRQTRDRYTLIALRQIGRDLEIVKGMEERVKILERNSVVLFMRNHPKMAVMIMIGIFILLNAWFVSDFRKVILTFLGLPKELVP